MEQLDCPEAEIWNERRLWFEAREAEHAKRGSTVLSEQACALMVDLQAVFCAGAWAAVVILAAAIVDAQRRSAPTPRRRPPRPLRWLRRLRNALLHEDSRRPVLTIEHQWGRRHVWEERARRAVETALSALYPVREAERDD